VLLLGPTFSPDDVGGMQIAIRDLAHQLDELGYRAETFIDPVGRAGDAGGPALRTTRARSKLASLARLRGLFTLWHRLPVRMRRAIAALFMPLDHYVGASDNLAAVEALLAGVAADDIVLCFVDGSPPGMTALVTGRHSRTLVVSLGGLADELRAGWWPLARLLCRLRYRRKFHSHLLRRAEPGAIRAAVFASRGWRDEALAAGLPPGRDHTVYFGIPCPPPVQRPECEGRRILWLGRLVPDKGLHLILDEFARIRARHGDLRLTAVAAQGQAEYRGRILEMIDAHGLTGSVELLATVEREELQALYASHDLLFFYSRYGDPVALVMMEAFAAGLPVVASQAQPGAALVRDGETCLCYDPADGDSIVDAVSRLLSDAELASGLAARADRLVRAQFSLEAMGRAYDEVLRANFEDLRRD